MAGWKGLMRGPRSWILLLGRRPSPVVAGHYKLELGVGIA